MARGQAAPSVFPEHAEYAPLLCDILRGGLTWLFRSGGLSHARRLLPESGRRAALLHAKRVWGGRAVRHAQPAKPAKRRKEDNLGHAKSREPHPDGRRAGPLQRREDFEKDLLARSPSRDMGPVTGARDKFSIFCYGSLVFAAAS